MISLGGAFVQTIDPLFAAATLTFAQVIDFLDEWVGIDPVTGVPTGKIPQLIRATINIHVGKLHESSITPLSVQ